MNCFVVKVSGGLPNADKDQEKRMCGRLIEFDRNVKLILVAPVERADTPERMVVVRTVLSPRQMEILLGPHVFHLIPEARNVLRIPLDTEA